MTYLYDSWYVAAWQRELDDAEFVVRRILDKPIVIFRHEGVATALLDRCPHRFAPLHRGSVVEGGLQCGYHGLVFDRAGACVFNPQGAKLSSVRVEAFEVVEAYGFVWIWMGEHGAADPATLPDLSFMDRADPRSLTPGYTHVKANYELLNDNIMDLGHVDYLHPKTLAQGNFATLVPKSQSADGLVSITWEVTNVPASGLNRSFIGDKHIDTVTQVVWQAAGNMRLSVVMRPTGGGEGPVLTSEACHLMTPETATTTHYFHCGARDFGADDAELTAARREFARIAFDDEDKPMVEAVQLAMEGRTDLMAMKPALLAGDGGAVRVRRALAALIEAEQANGASREAEVSPALQG